MKFKKLTAALLCAAMTVSFCSCNSNKKATAEIEGILEEYVNSVRETDTDGVLGLTAWEDDDKDYKNIEELIDDSEYCIDLLEFKQYIASTITVSYESEDIEIEGKTASVKVTYEMVDWEHVYNTYSKDENHILERLKDSDDTMKIKGKIEFELIDGEWQITKITKLNEVFEFCFMYPLVDFNPSIDDPIPTVPNETEFEDVFSAAIEAYIELMESEEIETGIRLIDEHYSNMFPCGLYDIDKDGIPELYFIAGKDTPTYNGSLYIYDYNENSGKAECVVEFQNVCYQAGDGGSLLMYTIPDGFVIQTANGGEFDWRVSTYIYNYNWKLVDDLRYSEEVVFEGDNYDDMRMEYSYTSGEETITEENYLSTLLSYINSGNVILLNQYYITANSNEAPILNLPAVTLQHYDDALNELYSML